MVARSWRLNELAPNCGDASGLGAKSGRKSYGSTAVLMPERKSGVTACNRKRRARNQQGLSPLSGVVSVTNLIYFCKFRGVNFTGLGLVKVTNFIFILGSAPHPPNLIWEFWHGRHLDKRRAVEYIFNILRSKYLYC
jgi:hypothetical protein